MATTDDLDEKLEKLREIMVIQTEILAESLREVSPAIYPKTYRAILPPTALPGDDYKAVALLRPDTKYITITNNSLNLLEVQFTKDVESGFADVIFPLSTRRFDLNTAFVYCRQLPPSPVAGEVRVAEYILSQPVTQTLPERLGFRKGGAYVRSETRPVLEPKALQENGKTAGSRPNRAQTEGRQRPRR